MAKKFEMMYVPNEGTISVIPTTAKMCIKAVRTSTHIDKIREELSNIPVEPGHFGGDYGPSHSMQIVKARLDEVEEFINMLVNTLEDDEEDEDD